jgi:hypothetical protein
MENAVPSSDDRPKRNATHAFRAVGDDGGLVVMPEQAKVQVLNPVGSRIFSLLDGTRTRDDIVRIITEEFDVVEDQARADLDAYLDQLQSHDMLADSGTGA